MNGQRGKRRGSGGSQQQAGSAGAARRRDREERFANSKWGLAPSAEALPPPPPAWRRAGCRPEPDRALPLKLLLNLATAMAAKRSKHKVWAYFKVASEDEKMAVCNLCKNEYSFKTTVCNLRKHLRHKHSDQVLPEIFEDEPGSSAAEGTTTTVEQDDSPNRKSTDTDEEFLEQIDGDAGDDDEEWKIEVSKQNRNVKGRGKKRSSALWYYFNMSSLEENKAVCRLCQAVLSYKTSISNLKTHLVNRHPNVLEQLDRLPSFTADMDEDCPENGDQSESISCKNECDMEDYEVIEEVLLSDNLEPCDDTNGGGEKNCEEDTTKKLPLIGTRVKNKRRFSKIETMPRSSESIKKKMKPDSVELWTRSCEKFGAYVASLMLQIPRDVASNYQVQIVKRLIDESTKYQGIIDL